MPKQQHSRLPWIRQLVDYSYNSQNGKLRSVTYANGLTVAYAYNTLELLEEVCYTKNAKKNQLEIHNMSKVLIHYKTA